jgi:hypothetical protein
LNGNDFASRHLHHHSASEWGFSIRKQQRETTKHYMNNSYLMSSAYFKNLLISPLVLGGIHTFTLVVSLIQIQSMMASDGFTQQQWSFLTFVDKFVIWLIHLADTSVARAMSRIHLRLKPSILLSMKHMCYCSSSNNT